MARIENWNPPQLNHTKATYSWNVPYAADVHEGYYTDEEFMPPRPWTEIAISEILPELEFKYAYEQTNNLTESFDYLIDVYFNQFRNTIVSDLYNWPRATQRKSGEYVEAGLRNIKDTGELLRSQQLEVE